MKDSKLLLEPRKKYNFVLFMSKEDNGKWVGEVWRCPHPLQQQTGYGYLCSTICRDDSEDQLKNQLDSIVNEYDR